MGKLIILFFAGVLIVYAGPINKSSLDIKTPVLAKSTTGSDYLDFSNTSLEATLIKGGYYTIGTNTGALSSKLDDHCAITFGHPYAKTSYPLISIDGLWYKPDEFFTEPPQMRKSDDGDTLSIFYEKESLCRFSFHITSGDQAYKLAFFMTVTNLDTLSHNFASGLVIDPGIGKWGDGYIFFGDEFLTENTVFDEWPESTPLLFYEKSAGAKGMCFELDFDPDIPEKIIDGNWQDLYSTAGPEFTGNPLNKLYDLCTKIIWPDNDLPPQQSDTITTVLSLNDGDFSADVFMRWDLASFLSIDNNRLFPRDYETSFEVYNLTDETIENLELIINTPTGFSLGDSESHVTIPSGYPAYPQVNLQSNLVYEDYIVGLTARLEVGGEVLDEISRNVYLPATALSDTGLTITNDSLSVINFPDVNLIFGVEINQTEQKVLNLRKENIFLFENGERIRDYSFDKFTIGGSNLADIVFVLDCSGSMQDNIDAVRDNLNEFADTLTAKGYDYRIGVVTFSTTVDDVWDFTTDIEQVKDNLSGINLWGGVEDSPAALYTATELSWRPGSRRNIIWITDEPYPEDSYTKEEIVDRMLFMGITVHGVGLNELQTDWFNPIVMPTGGNFYDIFGNFRDILLDVTDFNSQFLYSILYESPNPDDGSNTINLEIHFEGLGGSKIFMYEPPAGIIQQNSLVCYPNPFNPSITFKFDTQNIFAGQLSIYNLLGQRVKKIQLSKDSPRIITWNAHDDQNRAVVSGVYIVRLSFTDLAGQKHSQSARILHLK